MSREKAHDEIYCRSCGEPVKKKAEICPECGVPNQYSEKKGKRNQYQQETQRTSAVGSTSQGQQDTQRTGQSLEGFFDSLFSSEQIKHNPSEYDTTVSGSWYYGVAVSVIFWIVALALSDIASIISILGLIAWVLMPVSIYYDRNFLRATTNWNPNLTGWVISSIIPLINIVAGTVYLFRRYNAPRISSPNRGISHSHQENEALQQLRERYSKGELTDAEFEEKVEQLVGTENEEKAQKHIRSKESN